MYRAYKFRLYPNKEQKEIINKTFGCIRVTYNYYLDDAKQTHFKGTYYYLNHFNNILKIEKPFLQEIDSKVINKTLFRLQDNIVRARNTEFGFPKFKGKYGKNSYTIKDNTINLDLLNKEIELPNLGKMMIRGYRNHQNLPGKIVNATISKEANGKYYVSVLCLLPNQTKIKPNSIVGIDLGIKKLVTLSDGITYDNNKYVEKYEKRIKKVSQDLSRKEKESKNYFKCKKKLSVLYCKLANARKYYLHKITKEITDNYDIICAEKLCTKEMIMKKELSKELTDASLSEILRQLKYKSEEKGKYFYGVDTFYPSSQICSRCDHRDQKYKNLSERTYNCTNCHNTLDRDLNASINIMFEGLKLFMKERSRRYS